MIEFNSEIIASEKSRHYDKSYTTDSSTKQKINQKIYELENEQTKMIMELELKTRWFSEQGNLIEYFANVLLFSVVIGFVMTVYGFNQWYRKIQKPADEKLQLELTLLKQSSELKINNI